MPMLLSVFYKLNWTELFHIAYAVDEWRLDTRIVLANVRFWFALHRLIHRLSLWRMTLYGCVLINWLTYDAAELDGNW